jgi:hypothetical protein
LSATLVISNPRGLDIVMRIEASPPVPLDQNGAPDVDSPDLTLEHVAALMAAQYLGEASGNPIAWQSIHKDDE